MNTIEMFWLAWPCYNFWMSFDKVQIYVCLWCITSLGSLKEMKQVGQLYRHVCQYSVFQKDVIFGYCLIRLCMYGDVQYELN